MVDACGRGRARVAGGDARDVRRVEGDLRHEGPAPLTSRVRAGERAGDDDLPVHPRTAALREALRVAESGATEKGVTRVDAVVDDTDLQPVPTQAVQRRERGRSDDVWAVVRRLGEADVGCDPIRDAEPDEPRELPVRKLDGE